MVSKYASAALEGNKDFDIVIRNEAIQQSVSFKPFIKSFSDIVNVKVAPTDVYGRMDAIQSYQNTSRTVNISFSVPSVSQEHSITNLKNIQTLMRFQYPIYDTAEEANIAGILAPPLCSMMLANLTSFNSNNGRLYGYLSSVNYTPDFTPNSTLFFDKKNMYAQLYEVSLQFTVIHVDKLGWYKKAKGYSWRGNLDDDSTKKSSNSNDAADQAALNKVGA